MAATSCGWLCWEGMTCYISKCMYKLGAFITKNISWIYPYMVPNCEFIEIYSFEIGSHTWYTLIGSYQKIIYHDNLLLVYYSLLGLRNSCFVLVYRFLMEMEEVSIVDSCYLRIKHTGGNSQENHQHRKNILLKGLMLSWMFLQNAMFQ